MNQQVQYTQRTVLKQPLRLRWLDYVIETQSKSIDCVDYVPTAGHSAVLWADEISKFGKTKFFFLYYY